jgi:3-methyladenine DNA glycosylase AlkD
MEKSEILEKLKQQLLEIADEANRISGQRYFKEEVKLYGIKSAEVVRIGKEYFQLIKNKPKQEIFDLCDTLWQSGFMEESFIACNWSHYLNKDYQLHDFKVFERWVKNYINNWASCDTFCNHTIGDFIRMYPDFVKKLKGWAKSENRWVKRAAAVSLIIPARKGEFLSDIFEIASILLEDKDDMVQKGYGWMLKAASQAFQTEVYDFVMKNKHRMPRTALRYAIEKMPPGLKAQAMKK